jgi:hypothetical protein
LDPFLFTVRIIVSFVLFLIVALEQPSNTIVILKEIPTATISFVNKEHFVSHLNAVSFLFPVFKGAIRDFEKTTKWVPQPFCFDKHQRDWAGKM